MKFSITGLVFVASAIFTGCVYQGDKPAMPNANRASASPSYSNSNANGVVIEPAPQSGDNSAMANRLSPSRNRKIEEMRLKPPDPNAPKPDVEQILKSSTRPAPENSEFSVALTDILIERRVFPSHPQLSKVEKVTEGEAKRLTVWLRDGRVLEAPGDSVEGLSTVSSATILKAVGIDARAGQPVQSKPGVDRGKKPLD